MSIEASGSTIAKNWFIERRTKWIDLEVTYSFPRPLACPVCKPVSMITVVKVGVSSPPTAFYAKTCQISFMGEVIWSHSYERMPIFIVSSLIHMHTQPLQSCGTWKEFIIEITIHIKKWLCKAFPNAKESRCIRTHDLDKMKYPMSLLKIKKKNSPMLLW